MPNTTPKSHGDQPHVSQTRAYRFLLPREITTDAAFQFRKWGTDTAHVKSLAQTLRTVGDLDAILVWQEIDADSQPTGRLILLDGHHRLAAYATAKGHRQAVPAIVLTGDHTGAMETAVTANSRESLSWTKAERMDAAWRLVRLPGRRLTVPAVAKAAGVAPRTVDIMRKRWKAVEATGKVMTGNWWNDRLDALPEMEDRPEMTDAARNAAIEQLAESISKALGKTPWQDQDLVAEALQRAVGTHKLRSMAEYLFSGDDEFAEDDAGTFAGTVLAPEVDTEACDF